jgi:hypothetical protein
LRYLVYIWHQEVVRRGPDIRFISPIIDFSFFWLSQAQTERIIPCPTILHPESFTESQSAGPFPGQTPCHPAPWSAASAHLFCA